MATIKINIADVMNSSPKAGSAKAIAETVADGILSTKWRTDSRILYRNGIAGRLDHVQRQVAQLERDILAIYRTAESGAIQYQNIETWIVNLGRMLGSTCGKKNTAGNQESYEAYFKENLPDDVAESQLTLTEAQIAALIKVLEENEDGTKPENMLAILGIEYSNDKKIFGELELSAFLAGFSTAGGKLYFGKAEVKIEDSAKESVSLEDISDKLNINDKLEDSEYRKKEETKAYIDDNGNIISEDDAPEFYERKVDIVEIKEEVSESVTLLGGEANIGNRGKVSAEIGTAEAHASISAGVYVIDANGDKKFSPGVQAEIGTSVTALEADWEQQWLGDENFGFNTEVEATIGKAEAKADVTAQVFDEDGKLDMQIGVSGSAEAIAAEIEGKVGVNVLGGEVGVTGGVNFGVGAHADIGIRDGVVKCDVGASLGLGVSVDIEVDVGGMIDTVVDSACSIWDDAWSGWNSIWN